jgi:hypothetical protein
MKRKILLGIFSIAICHIQTRAQSFDWAVSIAGFEDAETVGIINDEYGNYINIGNFEGYVSAGPYSVSSQGDTDYYISQHDNAGSPLWIKSFGGLEDVESTCIAKSLGSSFLVGAQFEGEIILVDSIFNNANQNGLVTWFDSSGSPIWNLNFESQEDVTINCISFSSSDEIGYVGGTFEDTLWVDSIQLSPFGSNAMFIAGFNSSGEIISLFQSSALDEIRPRAISNIPNKGFLISGSFDGNALIGGEILSNLNGTNAFMAKVDSTGSIDWIKNFEAIGNSAIDSQTEDILGGTYYVAGTFEEGMSIPPYELIGNNSDDGFILKIDTAGEVVWIQQVQSEGDIELSQLDYLSSGKIIGIGTAESSFSIDSNETSNFDNDDLFIFSFTETGELEFSKSVGGTSDVKGLGFVVGSNEDLVLTGDFEGTIFFDDITVNGLGNKDVTMAKLNLFNVSITEDSNLNYKVKVYPNPTSDNLNFSTSTQEIVNVMVEILDYYGRIVGKIDEVDISGKWRDSIDLNFLPKGIYIIRIRLNDQLQIRRIIKS